MMSSTYELTNGLLRAVNRVDLWELVMRIKREVDAEGWTFIIVDTNVTEADQGVYYVKFNLMSSKDS